MLDKNYKPLYLYTLEMEDKAAKLGGTMVKIGIERENGYTAVRTVNIITDGDKEENYFYVERTVKTMLYAYGGYRVHLYAPDYIIDSFKKDYTMEGARAFDVDMMQKFYLEKFEIIKEDNPDNIVESYVNSKLAGGFDGYRIGFDAGGSDRKVTACIDGKIVFDDETVWFPKINSDPQYHIDGICDSIDRALAALGGKLDAIGVSTAGTLVNEEVRVASLFRKVPEELFKEKLITVYKDLSKKYGVPVRVVNDGDVSAVAGAMAIGEGRLMGIAMGTSLASGYIDGNQNIQGFINELAFAPVDANKGAEADEWSGDVGVGTTYMSQDAVIKLMKEAGVEHDDSLPPAEKLKIAQKLVNGDDPIGIEIFERMGDYFGYSIMYFSLYYDIKTVLFLGRVASGKGGDIILKRSNEIVSKYSQGKISVQLPDEKTRRLGQSYVAASLVKLDK